MKWIRIWTHKTVYGSTFQELNAEERGIWFSLLVLAGLEPNEGIVEMRKGIAWKLRSLGEFINCQPRRLQTILKKLSSKQINKIEFLPDGRIKIVKWEQYQTEYERYRKPKSGGHNLGQTSKETTTAKIVDKHPRQIQKQIKDVDKKSLPPSPPSGELSKNQKKGNRKKEIVDKSVDKCEAVWLKRLEDVQWRTWGTALINERGLGVLLDGEGKASGFGDPRLLWLAIARTKTVPRIPMRYFQTKAKDQDAIHRLRKQADNMRDGDFDK